MSKKKKNKKDVTNRLQAYETNPIVQADGATEMNVPIPSEQNVEFARDQNENHKS